MWQRFPKQVPGETAVSIWSCCMWCAKKLMSICLLCVSVHECLKIHSLAQLFPAVYAVQQLLGGRFATFHRVKAEFAEIGRVSREGTHLVFEYYFHTYVLQACMSVVLQIRHFWILLHYVSFYFHSFKFYLSLSFHVLCPFLLLLYWYSNSIHSGWFWTSISLHTLEASSCCWASICCCCLAAISCSSASVMSMRGVATYRNNLMGKIFTIKQQQRNTNMKICIKFCIALKYIYFICQMLKRGPKKSLCDLKPTILYLVWLRQSIVSL